MFRLAAVLGAPFLGAAMRGDARGNMSKEDPECPPAAFPDGKHGCVDTEGNHVPMACCGGAICQQEISRFAMEATTRLQTYRAACSLLPTDMLPIDGAMAVTDATRLCSETCQELPALLKSSPLQELTMLESVCADEISKWQALLQPLAVLDEAWSNCEVGTDELRKTTIPVIRAIDWNISGTISSIQTELRYQADFPVSCSSGLVGAPVWFEIESATVMARQHYQKIWANGSASIEGMGLFATKAAYLYEVAGKGLQLAHELATTPSKGLLDAVVDSLLDSSAGPLPSPLSKFWRWLLTTENTAVLTAEDRVKKSFSQVAKFQCMEGSVEGTPAKAFVMWVDGHAHTPVTARHLAFLITSLA